MAQLSLVKKIIKEDFAQQFQDMIGKIAFVINPALLSIQSILNNGLTLEDNFQGLIKSITVQTTANGTPTVPITFPTGLNVKIAHMLVTGATNNTNSNVYPTGTPFVSYSQNSNNVTINNITGLPINNTFTLTLVLLV